MILVRQFRYPAYVNGHDDLLIEAAAGVLDGEAPEVRIRAEAEEETEPTGLAGTSRFEFISIFQ